MTEITPDSLTAYIVETYPGTDVVEAMDARFFSLDRERHWPNFATIVTTDEHDMGSPSNLTARPDVFRLNIGVGRQTFDRLVGGGPTPDFTALDTVIPHPVYAAQHWLAILNPSPATFETIVAPLLREAHDRVAATRARHEAATRGSRS